MQCTYGLAPKLINYYTIYILLCLQAINNGVIPSMSLYSKIIFNYLMFINASKLLIDLRLFYCLWSYNIKFIDSFLFLNNFIKYSNCNKFPILAASWKIVDPSFTLHLSRQSSESN